MLQGHWVYVWSLFAALGQSALALALFLRVSANMIRDPYYFPRGITVYRLILLVVALIIFLRSGPVAMVLMFDPPYPLTTALTTQYATVIGALPLVVAFTLLVELTKGPLTRKLKEPGVEVNRPPWREVRQEALIVLVCLVLAYLIVMGRG